MGFLKSKLVYDYTNQVPFQLMGEGPERMWNYCKKFRDMHTHQEFRKWAEKVERGPSPFYIVEDPGVKKSPKHPEPGGRLDLSISSS